MFHHHMIAALTLAFAVSLTPCLTAQACGTEVRDDITSNQTWTLAGSPYCVTANVNISATVTIRPGVAVRVADNKWAKVVGAGKVLAVGTAAAPITFTSIDPTKQWRGLTFGDKKVGVITGSAAGSIVSHCQFSLVKIGPALHLQETVVQVDNCLFTGNVRGALKVVLSTDDLTINECTFSKNDTTVINGAGIQAALTAGNLTVNNCTFTNNSVERLGGAIYADMEAGTLQVSGCAFISNSADPIVRQMDMAGGAICVEGDVAVRESSFESNRARGWRQSQTAIARGGAIANLAGTTTLTNCVFKDNLAEGSFENVGVNGRAHALGGAVFAAFGAVQVSNSLFSGNRTSTDGTTDTEEHGAAIFTEGFFPTDLVNCTVTRGTTVSGADGGLYFAGGTATIRNSILWGNAGAEIGGGAAATVTFSVVDGPTVFPGKGNINVDPGFATGSIGAEIIAVGSPCIDAGDPASADDDVCFPPSLGGARNDMGAHGGPLACGWSSVPATRFYLTTSAGNLTTPAPLTLMLAGGVPGSPAALFITAVNHSPIIVGLPVLLMIEAEGTASLPLNVPVMPFATVLDFQGYALANGRLESTNTANVVFL